VQTDWEASAFTLQKEEVSEVAWCDRNRIVRMLSENVLYNYGDAYYRMLFDYGRRKYPHVQRKHGRKKPHIGKYD
jgi:hypothetical protein